MLEARASRDAVINLRLAQDVGKTLCPALHLGAPGEDGPMKFLLKLLGIPHCHCCLAREALRYFERIELCAECAKRVLLVSKAVL